MTTKLETLTRPGQIRRMRQIAGMALDLFPVEPISVSLLEHFDNTTFAVTDSAARQYALHVIRPLKTASSRPRQRQQVESELWWIDRLRAGLRLVVPSPVRSCQGATVVEVAVPETDETRLCTLLDWVDGRFVRNRITPSRLHSVGRLTARLHQHSSRLSVPDGFDRPRVDRADIDLEESAVTVMREGWSAGGAELVGQAFEWVRAAQAELGMGRETFGLIHADIHQNNYLFHRGEVRLIDFGDCGWGHYLYDLAVTLQQLTSFPRFGDLRSALLAGYRELRDLSPAHERLIDAFRALRQAQDVSSFVSVRNDPSYARWTAGVGDNLTELESILAHR